MTSMGDVFLTNDSGLLAHSMYHGRNHRGVYELDFTLNAKLEEQRKCFSDLSSLSILRSENIQNKLEIQETERPVTPINEIIRSAPKTFASLCKLVRRRINPRPHWDHISIEDQRSMEAVLLGEVNAIWPTFRKQVKDPFLTDRQNKELQRRITVHIVTVCEQLFLYYCGQVKVLNDRGVFSEAANMSRIRGQLAFDADKYLNLLSVRRHIVSDLKKTAEEDDTMMISKKKGPITPIPPKYPRHLSFRSLIRSSRPRDQKHHEFNMTAEIKDLRTRMPSMDLEQVHSLLPSKSIHDFEDEDEEVLSERSNIQTHFDAAYVVFPMKSIYKKWASEPLLTQSDLHHEVARKEREETQSPTTQSRHLAASPQVPFSASKRKPQILRLTASAPQQALAGPFRKLRSYRSTQNIDPKQDLANLLARQSQTVFYDGSGDEANDIPPLIQAITRREEQDEKEKQLEKDEADLDERKRLFEEEQRKPLPAPVYPQPPVVEVQIPGHANPFSRSSIIIRTSDIHVPDKVDLPAVSLQMHGPLYNDLTGDVSPATVKELDANLFQDEELKEVYGEIMKTVPDSHLHFHNDPLVVKPAVEVDLSKILASSSLVRPRSQQVINPKLTTLGAKPPWGEESQRTWERRNQPPRTAGTSTVSGGHAPTTRQANQIPARTSRSYASWLAWWKATINTDDYLKYLSTQETDFLGVIFHFYDSEIAESEIDSDTRSEQLENERKKMEIVAEIKAKKEHFIRGVWNANSIWLGGLGKYPDLEEYAEQVRKEEEAAILEEGPHTLPRILSASGMPQSTTSDDSAGSESSYKRNSLLRRKSATPRRRQTPVQICASELASSESSDDANDIASVLSKARPCSVESSGEEGQTAKIPLVSRGVPGSNKKKKNLLRWCKDSGMSSAETEVESEPELLSSEIESCLSGPPASHSDEPSSGYYSPDHLIADYKANREMKRKLQMQSRQGQKHSCKAGGAHQFFVPMKAFEKVTTEKSSGKAVVSFGEQRISFSRVISIKSKPINLLRRYYKSISGVPSVDKSKSTHTMWSQVTPIEKDAPPTLQSRWEAVWKKLRMPASHKVDAALKYSSDQHLPYLTEIVRSWEKVSKLIVKRETIMHELELFERDASDPSRFFVKGTRGSSSSRLREARLRSEIYQRLDECEKVIAVMLRSIYTQFGDIVTYAGRPYHEKMSSDKTEMLYWLQQERRCQNLADKGYPEQLRQFMRENHVTAAKQSVKSIPVHVRTVTLD